MARYHARKGKIQIGSGEWQDLPTGDDAKQDEINPEINLEISIEIVGAHIPMSCGLDYYLADSKHYIVSRN